MARCELEELPPGSRIARIGGDDFETGDEYHLSFVVVPKKKKSCLIEGLDRPPTTADWMAMDEALAKLGFEKVIWFRRKERIIRRIEMT